MRSMGVSAVCLLTSHQLLYYVSGAMQCCLNAGRSQIR